MGEKNVSEKFHNVMKYDELCSKIHFEFRSIFEFTKWLNENTLQNSTYVKIRITSLHFNLMICH